MDNKNLSKLIDFIDEISELEGNEWFVKSLKNRILSRETNNLQGSQLDEIYEHCLQKILKEHAQQFYQDFKLLNIKQKLIEDFIRMERFRRDGNFEDFCLAAFQQIEGIVNELSTHELQETFLNSFKNKTHKIKNKATGILEEQMLWQLIFFPGLNEDDLIKKTTKKITDWDFMERYKLVLYFFYYNNKIIFNYYDFQNNFFLGNELYQVRNSNHRGGQQSEKQKITKEKVTNNSHKYYFRFLGFLEDFISKVNTNIS
jgi:hypothetical protein